MKFNQIAILSTILCLVLSSVNMSLTGILHPAEVFGAFLMANIPALIYLLVKRKQEKSGITFLILQNILALLSLIGNAL